MGCVRNISKFKNLLEDMVIDDELIKNGRRCDGVCLFVEMNLFTGSRLTYSDFMRRKLLIFSVICVICF